MGGRLSAQAWYRDRRSRLSGEAGRLQKSYAGLRAGKNGSNKLDIGLLCRILAPDCKKDCEVSICANDKPTKCYHVWQKILYASLPIDLVSEGYPLVAPRRMIIPSKKNCDEILLGEVVYSSLYVHGTERNDGCNLDHRFHQGLIIIKKITSAELPKAELSQRLMTPQNKGKLLKYFSRDLIESIKKEYSYGVLKLKLPDSINHNH